MSEIHQDHNHSHDHNHDENLEAKKATRPKIEHNNNYWLSIDQYMQDPEFKKTVETEFLSSPLREEEKENPWARREFLKLMGASLALSTASCIRRPVQKIVPYNKQPEEITFGVPNFYTSTFFDGQESLGVLVKTREGRPIKLESLPTNPVNQGGTSVRSQAHVLSLYDPQRLGAPKKNLFNEKRTNKDTVGVSWEDADAAIVESLKKGGVYILTGNVVSPSTQGIIKDFSEGFKATHVAWEVLANEDVRKGQMAAFKTEGLPYFRFDKSKMTVSIDADFLGTWIAPTVFTKQYSKSRKDLANMSRMIAFDSNYSLTGANADIRVRIKPSQQLKVAVALAQELVVNQGKSSYAQNSEIKNWLGSFGNAADGLNIEPALLKEIAKDLWDNKGQSLIVAGGIKTQTAASKDLQTVVNFLNAILDNDGKTIQYKKAIASSASHTDMLTLIEAMKQKKVKTLVIHSVNPVYALPTKLGFVEALKNVDTVVYIGESMNETAHWANYVLPENHSMENWGDSEFVSGVFAIQQPAIKPMYDTQSMQITLMNWCFQAKVGPKRIQEFESYYDYLRNFWKTEIFPKHGKAGTFEKNWQDLLQTGSIGEADASESGRGFSTAGLTDIKKPAPVDGWEVVLYSTSQLGDGSSSASNIGWLHELPDPVSKVVWDNYAAISMAAAAKLKVKGNQTIEITVGKDKLELPVLIQPGLQDDVIAIAIGYGRTHVGEVGNGIGKNAYDLVQVENGQLLFSGLKA
jgi:MoCo/4Fe-4S cofactor protein with predicted Tat translocation signal